MVKMEGLIAGICATSSLVKGQMYLPTRNYGHVCQTLPVLSGPNKTVEKLWLDFFSNPSHWWDHRPEKDNARYPDFKHKQTRQGLWIVDKLNPSWVSAELAAMAPGIVQLNVFSWNKRLARHDKACNYLKTMEVFHQMQREGIKPDKFTYVPVLNACSSLRALEQGRQIHAQIIQSGHESDVYVGSCLVDMYAKFGCIDDADKVFKKMPKRDVHSWNPMILGYVKCGQGQKALEVFRQMQQAAVDPDHFTFLWVLNACASVLALEEGRAVHKQIIERGCETNNFVATSLFDMYVKCGSVDDAWRVFNILPTCDVVNWNTMIHTYVKSGQGLKALDLYRKMQCNKVESNRGTFLGVLNACASVGAIDEGRRVHKRIKQSNFKFDVIVNCSLVDMYSKCGCIEDAEKVFAKMPARNAVTWTAMLRGYAMHGHAREALRLFEVMCQEGAKIDGVTLVSLLSTCCHVGLIDEGLQFYLSMSADYGISPSGDHHACVVDLLGRAGRLHEAEDLITKICFEPNASAWVSLLGACRVHGNILMAERAAKRVMESHPEFSSGYVLLSNTYVATGSGSGMTM